MSELTAAEKDAAQRVGVEIGAEVLYEKWQDAERRLSAAEQERDANRRNLDHEYQMRAQWAARAEAAEARVEALEAALHIIAPRLEERRTTRDKRLAEIARAALAGREETE